MMTLVSRTIELDLLRGDTKSMRTGEYSEGHVKAIVFPRVELSDTKKEIDGIQKVGAYVLVGSGTERTQKLKVYVGMASEVWQRLNRHNSDEDQDFWQETSVIVSTDDKFSTSHALYLESLLFNRIADLPGWELSNVNRPSDNAGQLAKRQRVIVEKRLEDAIIVFDALGSSVFRALLEHQNRKREKTRKKNKGRSSRRPESKTGSASSKNIENYSQVIFESSGKNHDTRMSMSASGKILIHKESTVTAEISKLDDKQTRRLKKLKDDLTKEKIIEKSNNRYLVNKNIVLDSLSDSTVFVSGYRSSSSVFWKYFDKSMNKYISLGEYKTKNPKENTVFYFEGKKFSAKMLIHSNNECTVLKDSKASLDLRKSADENLILVRNELIEKGVCRTEKNHLVFAKDYLFKSPNRAATVIAGSSTNARKGLRMSDGMTLGEWISDKGGK